MNLQQELLIDYQYELLINSEDRNCLIVVGDDDSWKIIDINNREIVENMHGVEKGADIYWKRYFRWLYKYQPGEWRGRGMGLLWKSTRISKF